MRQLQQHAHVFEATVAWSGREPLLPGRRYWLHICGREIAAMIAPLKYVVGASGDHIAATKLQSGETGVVQLELDEPVVAEPDGGFSVLDQGTRELLGDGRIRFALRRSQNVCWQDTDVDKQARAEMKGQRPCVVWLTGLSGAGKSTIANLLEGALHAKGCHTYLLDGDNLRHGLNRDLGFTPADRVENIRRAGEVAKLLVDAGLIVIASFISPYRQERRAVRDLLEEGEFFEVFVDAPLEVVERRDPKGLYEKARRGELVNFTGVDAPYEVPEHAELRIAADIWSPDESVAILMAALDDVGILGVPASIA